ncbi:hypothetical protein ACLB2K_015073 [Fragaria x ananassa]
MPRLGVAVVRAEFLFLAVLEYYGAGHLSATDNYKVLVRYFLKKQNEDGNTEMCTLSNEALHWLHDGDSRFDLDKEEFCILQLPNLDNDGRIWYSDCLEVHPAVGLLGKVAQLASNGLATGFGS